MSIKKTTNAFQYYLKHWKNLSEEEKAPFLELEKQDKMRYEGERKIEEEKEAEETKKLKMYIHCSGDRVPCVGLDNGFSSWTIRGPVVKLVEFTEKELEKLEQYGCKRQHSDGQILKYKEIIVEDGGKFTFDKKRSRKYDYISYNGAYIIENYDGEVGKFTEYNNYKGERWVVKY
jgi:hypothetical protein